jgi:hypothetical protein
MAEPTLKVVLKAIADLQAETRSRFDRVDDDLVRVHKELASLDRDLTKHMDVHKELEKDVEALKGRPLRNAARAPRRRPAR